MTPASVIPAISGDQLILTTEVENYPGSADGIMDPVRAELVSEELASARKFCLGANVEGVEHFALCIRDGLFVGRTSEIGSCHGKTD